MGTPGVAVLNPNSIVVGLNADGTRKLFLSDGSCSNCCTPGSPCCGCATQCPNHAVITFSGITNPVGDGGCCGNFSPCGAQSRRYNADFNRTFSFDFPNLAVDFGFDGSQTITNGFNRKIYDPTCLCAVLASNIDADIICRLRIQCPLFLNIDLTVAGGIGTAFSANGSWPLGLGSCLGTANFSNLILCPAPGCICNGNVGYGGGTASVTLSHV